MKIILKKAFSIVCKKPYIIASLSLLFLIILLRTAWVCDDAYITFRTVDNFVHGFGLRWNIAERVQSYTHPLWMFIFSIFYFITREAYYTSIFLSIAISLAMFVLFCFKTGKENLAIISGALILIFSKALIDYSTSGLENALSHLLLVIFFVLYRKYEPSAKKLFLLSLISSLIVLNRMDLILLVLPVLVFSITQTKSLRSLVYFFLGFGPFIIWEIFSLIYYGFLFPNTAYAKLNTGIPASDLINNGLLYFYDSLARDPLTLLIIFLSIILITVMREWKKTPIAIGIVLYLLYIVKIGGDFMSGRFFTAPLILSACIIADSKIFNIKSFRYIFPLFIIVLGFLGTKPSILSDKNYGLINKDQDAELNIVDERGFYYPQTGLLRAGEFNYNMPAHQWAINGALAKEKKTDFLVMTGVGFFGYFAGPGLFILDLYALNDPLLARLPISKSLKWRIGHFSRVVPHGYVATLYTGKNRIVDTNLREFYDRLALVVRGRIFSAKRLKEIVRFNLKLNDRLINKELYADTKYDENDVLIQQIFADPQLGKSKLRETYLKMFIEMGGERSIELENLFYRGDTLIAKKLYTDLCVNNPRIKDKYPALLACYISSNLDSALYYGRISVFLEPNNVLSVYNLGLLFGMIGQLDSAKIYYQKALSLDSLYIDAHTNLGVTFALTKEFDSSLAHFRCAVRLEPNNFDYRMNLIECLGLCRKQDEMIGVIDETIDRFPNHKLIPALKNLKERMIKIHP